MISPDWLPLHCMHCGTYLGHTEHEFAECPDSPCDHNKEHPTHSGTFVCPTCGYEWAGVPPEDWDGSLLYRPERPISTPPSHYDIDELGLTYSGPVWEDKLAQAGLTG